MNTMTLDQTYTVEGAHQRLIFEPSDHGGYGYALEFLTASGWQRISSDNPLVRGPSFNLRPSSVTPSAQDSLEFSGASAVTGANGSSLHLPFSGRVWLDSASGWLQLEVRVHASEDIRLNMNGGVEPEITVDLGALPPYDRGDHVWFKTSIDNPTKWNDEARGNDFPALYYFDSYQRYELMMFFDMTVMNWMSRANIARFLNYKCGFRRRYKPTPFHELGLHADGFSGTVFPAGEQVFAYSIKVRPQPDAPTEARALGELITECLKLVPSSASFSSFPPGSSSWQQFSAACAEELMDAQCWGSSEQFNDFILNYVGGYSPAWAEAFAGKGLTIDFKSQPCLDSAAFIGFPLTILNAVQPEPRYAKLLERIRNFSAKLLASDQNPYSSSSGITGTWQHLYILEQLWMTAHLHRDADTLTMIRNEVHNRIVPLARGCAYLFPLSFDKATLRKHGNGDAYAVGGLYAYLMFNLYRSSGDPEYLGEAKLALLAQLHLPVNSLSQEVFLLAIGLQAANLVWLETGDPVFKEVYMYLLAQNLRMMYWYTDQTRPEYRDYNIYGMFQACTPIIYPAFFENIECLARIASTFEQHAPSLGLLRVFDHARKNNFFMFPACLPANRHTSSLKYIPFENLGVLEDEKTGWIGQEIYGCGQVFQAHLMWEALAHAEDRSVMVLNISNYRALELRDLERAVNTFIVFNPEAQIRQTRIRLGDGSLAAVSIGASLESLEPALDSDIQVTLQPSQVLYLRVSHEGG